MKKSDILEKLKAIPPLSIEYVEIEGLGRLGVRQLTAGEYDVFQYRVFRSRGDGDIKDENIASFRSTLLQLCLVDEDGALIFDDVTIGQFMRLDRERIDEVYKVAARINGIAQEEKPGE